MVNFNLPKRNKNNTTSADTDMYDRVDLKAQDKEIPSWWTPFHWLDDAGVYIGNDGAWLYRSLPLDTLSSGGISPLLTLLAGELGSRDIHLVTHAWSAPTNTSETITSTGTPLDTYIAEAVRLHSPTRRFTLGVKLVAATKKGATKLGLADDIDRILGESVPDYDSYTNDYTTVETVLTRFNAATLDKEARDQLEAWYAHGVIKDIDINEKDNNIDIGGHALLVAATARPDRSVTTATTGTPAPVVGAVICLSARGTLTTNPDGTPALKNASLILARRSPITTPWLDELDLALPAARRAGLPLRQLPALDETLPCSTQRVNPLTDTINATALSHAGFTDYRPAGDKGGLLLGMAGMHYTDPATWNPLRHPGNTLHLVGGAGTGKTFLAEHLAVQADLAGLVVRYVSADANSGKILVDRGRTGWANAYAGMCDPGPQPGTAANWWRLCLTALAAATPKVPAAAYEQVFERHANRSTLPGLSEIPQAIYDPKAAAETVRCSRTRNTLAWAAITKDRDATGPQRHTSAWSLPHLLADFVAEFGEQTVIADMLCAAAILTGTDTGAPALVILDGTGVGPITAAAIAGARASGTAVAIVITHTTLPSEPAGANDNVVMFATDDTDTTAAHEWAGVTSNAMLDYCTPKRAVIDVNDTVTSAATAIYRDHHNRVSPLVVAPVHVSVLAGLTRNPNAAYPRWN